MKKKIICIALMLIMVLSLASCVVDQKYDYDMTKYITLPTVAGKEIEVKLDAVQATIDQDIISASVNTANKITANQGDTVKMSITIKEIYWVDKGDGTLADLTEIKDAQGNVVTPEHILFTTDDKSTTNIVETLTIANLGSGSFHKELEDNKFIGKKLGQEQTETYKLPADLSPLQNVLSAEQYAEILPFAGKDCRITYKFVSRQVREGDIVVLDFTGYYMDANTGEIKINTEGEPLKFEGGSATNSQVYVGSHLFIEDFEKGIIGFNVGEEGQFKATFPSDYSNDDLKGQTVIFKATIKEIYKPETYNLEFIKKNYGEYESVDAFEKEIIKSFATQEFLSYFLENTIVIDYPSKEYKLVKNQIEDMEGSFKSTYGMDFDTYIKYYYGFESREDYIKYTMKSEMAYYAYAQANGIEPTDGDISNARAVLIASYKADYLAAYSTMTEAEAQELATSYVDTQLTDLDLYQEALYSLVGDHFMTQYVIKEVPTTYTSVTKGGSLFTE